MVWGPGVGLPVSWRYCHDRPWRSCSHSTQFLTNFKLILTISITLYELRQHLMASCLQSKFHVKCSKQLISKGCYTQKLKQFMSKVKWSNDKMSSLWKGQGVNGLQSEFWMSYCAIIVTWDITKAIYGQIFLYNILQASKVSRNILFIFYAL